MAVAAVLAGCGSSDERYRDTQILERPPLLPIPKHEAALACCADEPVLPKASVTQGLGDAVSMVASKPVTLKIKQPFGTAWNNIGLALAQSEIKITDQERAQGIYYVAYQPASLFGGWLTASAKEVVYQVIVRPEGNETWVSAKPADTTEPQFESDLEEARADAEDLLYRLYETLRDDLVNQ